MGKIYITGDCHGAFKKIEIFCRQYKTTCKDVMIILGDAGINFYLSKWDKCNKSLLAKLELTFLCIHGNHEARPESLDTYKEKMWNGGSVYFEEEYPNILFAKDGEIYELNGKKAIAIGGAYSIDKEWRLLRGAPWFEDEQPSEEIKEYVEDRLYEANWSVDKLRRSGCWKAKKNWIMKNGISDIITGIKELENRRCFLGALKSWAALHFYRRWVFLYIKKVILFRSKYVKTADRKY